MSGKGFSQNRQVVDSNARKTSEGSAQLLQIDKGMNDFIADLLSRSSGNFVNSIGIFNGEKTTAMLNLGKAFDDFALGEGKFAAYIDQYDEEIVIK